MPTHQEIKELANKLISQGLATTMIEAIEKATDILNVEERGRRKRVIIKPVIKEQEKEQEEEIKNPTPKKDSAEYDISKETKTVKELMEEFSE